MRAALKLFPRCTRLSLDTWINTLFVQHTAQSMNSRCAGSFPLTSSGSFTRQSLWGSSLTTHMESPQLGEMLPHSHTFWFLGFLSFSASIHLIWSLKTREIMSRKNTKKKESWILNWPYSEPCNLVKQILTLFRYYKFPKEQRKRKKLLSGSYIKLRL